MLELSHQDVLVTLSLLAVSYWLHRRAAFERFPSLRIEQLFLYPIKSLPPLSLQTLEVAPRGFKYDRRFMLVSPRKDGTYENHLASLYPNHALLRQTIDFSSLTLTISAPGGSRFSILLDPPTSGRAQVEVDMYGSKTLAYDVGEEAARFFTGVAGKETRLLFLSEGEGGREVLGSISQGKDSGISFQDCASYMIASSASLTAFSGALRREMPIIPLRPNILVGPASESSGLKPWTEDYWAELRVAGGAVFRLTSNCVRCISLNIDYSTGKRLTGSNLPLTVLSKDRKVDEGSKSPVFGRYAFSESIGVKVSVGGIVEVTKLNKRRTTFDWPGI
ncbi:hypothetical protein JCM21900_002466 [Sporobolomyces salmonicolor]